MTSHDDDPTCHHGRVPRPRPESSSLADGKNSGNLTSSFCIRSSTLRAASVPSYKRTHPLGFALPFLSCAARSSITFWKGVSKCIDNLQSFFNVTRRSKNLNWLLSTLLTIIVLPNLVLELTMRLWATFRFAAGQKSISADDLVVFAEMFYLVSGSTSPWSCTYTTFCSYARFLGYRRLVGSASGT